MIYKLVSKQVSKLYFYKCAHFLLTLALSTFFIPHFYSYAKTFTLIYLIPIPHSPHSHPDPHIPTPIPCIPTMIHRILSLFLEFPPGLPTFSSFPPWFPAFPAFPPCFLAFQSSSPASPLFPLFFSPISHSSFYR